MNYNDELKNLQSKQTELNNQLSSLEGEHSLLSKQIKDSKHKIEEIDAQKIIYRKSIEFLRIVEQSTKTKMKEGFEKIVTYALRFIFQKDYKFNLEFKKRGNSQELNYTISTPEFTESFNPLDTSGGGVLDIISLALRIALLEKTKIKGFLALDESFRNIHNVKFIENAFKFLKEINKKLKKQIIFVTGIEEAQALKYANNEIALKQ